jgi:hypothetical protein
LQRNAHEQTFKIIYNLALAYLSDLISIRHSPRYNLRSQAAGIVLHDPTGRFKLTLGHRSIKAAAPKTWNNLPDYIMKEDNCNKFKSLLKTHYFREAFSNLT